jgi:hypothetical protein
MVDRSLWLPGRYETNQIKDYKTATENLKKILAIDPENKDAQQYISILEKRSRLIIILTQ